MDKKIYKEQFIESLEAKISERKKDIEIQKISHENILKKLNEEIDGWEFQILALKQYKE